jgi:Ice-binding-like
MKLKRYLRVIALTLMLPMLLLLAAPALAATLPNLGRAASFGVLAGSTVTNTGPTHVIGDVGVSPGTAVTGFPPGTLTGLIHAGDSVAQQAQSDVIIAYNDAAGQACNNNLTGQDLGGLTLTSAVYCFSSSAQLTGQLTLNGQGNPASVFIFQIGSTLTTASNSNVLLSNGAQPCNVFWQVGSSATLGTSTSFKGNILALTSITLNTTASSAGGLYARNGAVTLDTNNIQACGTPTPTNTPLPGATNTPMPRPTRPLPTDTAVPRPTNTTLPQPTLQPTNTVAPGLTDTPQPGASNTPQPGASNTPMPGASNTPMPGASNTPVAGATYTKVPGVTSSPTPLATPSSPGLPPTGSGLPWAIPLILLLGVLLAAAGLRISRLGEKRLH